MKELLRWMRDAAKHTLWLLFQLLIVCLALVGGYDVGRTASLLALDQCVPITDRVSLCLIDTHKAAEEAATHGTSL